jgi:DeoR family transcriptional regulator, glycerol-3-phosphate regulon repressor
MAAMRVASGDFRFLRKSEHGAHRDFGEGAVRYIGMTNVESTTRSFSRRQNEIMTLLRENGRVAVEELTTLFEVSPQTIRRDLNEMSEARVITRVHGGAIIASGVENLVYDARKLVAQAQKRLIGEAAARLIADNSSLFINIGTTTEEVAHALVGRSGLLVITNNLNVAAELYRNRSFDVIITGGSIRPSDGGIVGATAVDLIRQFRVDTAVIGTSAIDKDGTLLDFDIREVHASRAIIEIARKVILVTDSSKFSRSAPARIATLADVDILVTDHLPSPEVAELCRAHDVEVIEAGGPLEGDPASPD